MKDYFSKFYDEEENDSPGIGKFYIKPVQIPLMPKENYIKLQPPDIPIIPIIKPAVKINLATPFQLEMASIDLMLAKSRANQEGYGSSYYRREEELVQYLKKQLDEF